MARVTFTIDDSSARELERVGELLKSLHERLIPVLEQELAEGSPFVRHLLASLEALPEDPSASAVVRSAVGTYLAAIRDLERSAGMDAGYAALEAEEDRAGIMEGAAKRVAARWADEP